MSARAFLDAIYDDPNDDTPRLVYADWLDDRSEADRAELIRVQCELAAWVPDLHRRTELQERERQLLAEHEADWFEPLRAVGATVQFERGFPTVTLSTGPLKEDGQWCARVADQCRISGVQIVRLHDPRTELWTISRSPLILHERNLIRRRSGKTLGAAWRDAACSRGEQIVNSLGMEFASIPACTFLMGAARGETDTSDDETPQHQVTISQPFYLGIYPVTQYQYQSVMGRNPSDFRERNGGGPNHPVDTVSWHDAVAFCERLSEMLEERVAGRTYRLPTEAEWEHACRAGTTTAFQFGNACDGREVNCDGNYPYGTPTKGPYPNRTTRVGSYAPNAFGLYDMHGNLWEWCSDWYAPDSFRKSPAVDPTGPRYGEERVVRGGSWFFRATRCRSASRLGITPEGRYHIDGFRVVMSV